MTPEVKVEKKTKKIGEIFSDYKTNSNIVDCEITKMNLIKKSNILEIGISSKEYIEIKEMKRLWLNMILIRFIMVISRRKKELL